MSELVSSNKKWITAELGQDEHDKGAAAGTGLGYHDELGVHHRCDVHGAVALRGCLGKPGRGESTQKNRGNQHVCVWCLFLAYELGIAMSTFVPFLNVED